MYLVKWSGYPEDQATWEPESSLAGYYELPATIPCNQVLTGKPRSREKIDEFNASRNVSEPEEELQRTPDNLPPGAATDEDTEMEASEQEAKQIQTKGATSAPKGAR